LKLFRLRQLLGKNCIREKQIFSCCHFGETGETIFSSGWPSGFPVGNLLPFACWFLCQSQPELKKVKAVSGYKPFSYRVMDKSQLMEIEALGSGRFFAPEIDVSMGRRNFLHDAVYNFIFCELMKWSAGDLQLKLKELFEFHVQDEFVVLDRFSDYILDAAVFPVLHTVISLFCRENKDFLSRHPLPFTKQPLSRMGLDFSQGCFYECSGYGLHCFHLPDSQSSFFFQTNGSMSEVWYIFVRMLAESGYFANEPAAYTERLEKQLLLYPWLELEVSCT
jgi:hypothetical protein